ncbi:hypothetical protein Q0F99_19155 [Rathayibacter oskolensis]|uniref:hypothetical protein n=1 Tax=Rathayibacter oskolensis TaxID=1891671 RepID=UPI00265D7480|nr:hypothetical protein [Rathayibacter oskolensis]WKK71459.1 hypothetical protein Q0F99_19155 [Rathayibacter oskolensis]
MFNSTEHWVEEIVVAAVTPAVTALATDPNEWSVEVGAAELPTPSLELLVSNTATLALSAAFRIDTAVVLSATGMSLKPALALRPIAVM